MRSTVRERQARLEAIGAENGHPTVAGRAALDRVPEVQLCLVDTECAPDGIHLHFAERGWMRRHDERRDAFRAPAHAAQARWSATISSEALAVPDAFIARTLSVRIVAVISSTAMARATDG